MHRALLGLVLLALLSIVSTPACLVAESCDASDFDDHCEGAVAVTCPRHTSNGSGPRYGGDPVSRVRCTSGVCGKSCECFKECDICERKLIETVACDPDPASCEQTCRGL